MFRRIRQALGGSGEPRWPAGYQPRFASSTGARLTITVDGRAAVRWLTAYSLRGRDGELVGLTTSADALRRVQRVERQGGEGSRKLIDYLLERYGFASVPDYLYERCGLALLPHEEQYYGCIDVHSYNVVLLMDIEDTPFTRCMVEAHEEEHCKDLDGEWSEACEDPAYRLGYLSGYRYRLLSVIRGISRDNIIWRQAGAKDRYERCLPLAQDLLGDYGLEYREHYSARGRKHWCWWPENNCPLFRMRD